MEEKGTDGKKAKNGPDKGPGKGAKKARAGDTAARKAKKPAMKGADAKDKAAESKKAEKSLEKDSRAGPGADEEAAQGPAGEKERVLSEEDIRRLAEESLEKVTVADIVLTIMNELASVGYLKMGLPESANLKFRDLDQAGLAIDVLEGILAGAEGSLPEEQLRPFRSTLANMQMNFVQLKRGRG